MAASLATSAFCLVVTTQAPSVHLGTQRAVSTGKCRV